MNAKASFELLQSLSLADLRGIAQLAVQGTAGVTRVVEGVHQSVWNALGAPVGVDPARTRGITGGVYRGIHGITRLVGTSVDTVLAGLQALPRDASTAGDIGNAGTATATATATAAAARATGREAFLAALNGVLGDHLVATGNPLATPMTLRRAGGRILDPAMPESPPVPIPANGKLLLLIHGLCMNDLHWQAAADGAGPGPALAAAHGYTPLYLRYNSGLHTSTNGRELSQLLERLLTGWPHPVTEISLVGHSMGGLLARSAFHDAERDGLRWPTRVRNMVFLGTPHHGAPLERAGNWVDRVLAATSFSAPLRRIGQVRSAGITDLRHGNLLDADWQGLDRFSRRGDSRTVVPLPTGVACRAVAATLAGPHGGLAGRLLGDGLVPLHSAFGHHDDSRRSLSFPPSSMHIAWQTGHLALPGDPQVTQRLVAWLAPAQAS